MSVTSERAYELLPAIVREDDLKQGGPLEALYSVLMREGLVVEGDLARLLDNIFIETCDEWVVPYLGELLGVRGLHDIGSSRFSNRARVANTLAYRRRKGTATMLEQLGLDATGWRARVVEYFELLATTQWLNHVRLQSLETPDLRRGDALERLGSAFEETRHFVDVRRIAKGRGRYNLPNVGIFLWRLDSQYLAERTALKAAGTGAARGRFFIDPLGFDTPLFNRPQTERSILSLASELNVPGPLRRRPLDEELERRRSAIVNGRTSIGRWFGREPVFSISYRMKASDTFTAVAPEEILIANLSEPDPVPADVWLRPPKTQSYIRADDQAAIDLPIVVAVDPVLGRIAFPAGVVPTEVRVSAAHGIPGDVGGGPYDRRATLASFGAPDALWHAAVGRDLVADPAAHLFDTFEAAVAAWNAEAAGSRGLITLIDSGTYAFGGVTIRMKEGSSLLVTSADWPEQPTDDGGVARVPGRFTPSGRWAHLVGDIAVRSEPGSELWLDGLLIDGGVELENAGGAGLHRLCLTHSTIVPGRGTLTVGDAHDGISVELYRCIVGAIDVAATARDLRIVQSAVDAAGAPAIEAGDTSADIAGSTIVGAVHVRQLDATNSIFVDPLTVERRQVGCIRFSYIGRGSATPRRYRCQPDLALESATSPAEEAAIVARMVPDFTDELYGGPGYLQLVRTCPEEIRTGADDGAEMGVWWFLRQPQRETNLRSSLDEYLRLGLEAGLIFVT